MRLNRLTLTNFQSWKSGPSDLLFNAPVTLILGKNSSGKTSIARAIEVVLRGATPLSKPGAKGKLADMITDGEKFATVEVVIVRDGAQDVTIARTLGPKGSETEVNGHVSDKNISDFFSPADLLDPDAVLSVVCNVSGFFDLDDKKQRAILESLVDQLVPASMFESFTNLTDYLPAIPKTLDDLEEAYKAVYAKRTQANAQVDALTPVRKPTEPAPSDDLIVKIEAKLDELREQQKAGWHTEGRRREKLNTLRLKVDEIKRNIAMAEAKLPKDSLEILGKRLAQVMQTLSDCQKAQAKREELKSQHEKLVANIKGLSGLGATCVISDAVTCPLEKPARAKFVKSWTVEADKIVEAVAASPDFDMPKALTAVAQAEREHKLRESIEPEIKKLMKLLETATAELQDAEKENAALDTEMGGPNPVDERIKNGSKKLSEAHAARAEWAAWTTFDTSNVRLMKVQADLNALCKALGPGGFRETLLASRLETLESRLNSVLNLFGIKLSLSDGKAWNPRLNGRAIATASESERYRAGIALQIAVAELSGLRFIVVDGADILDSDNRSALFNAVKIGLDAKYLDQAILFATLSNDAALTAKRPEWVGMKHITMSDIGSIVE